MRRFRTPDRDQLMLMPPNLNDWVSEKHPARFALAFVEKADLGSIYGQYNAQGDGQPPYDPKMMVAILLYASMCNIRSSREIERKLSDDIGFRFLAGQLKPDHDTLADFRQRHHRALKELFQLSVKIAVRSELVTLAHVSLDGTKVRANASRSKVRTQQQLDSEIARLVNSHLDEAQKIDTEEDKKFGKGNNGYLLPDSLASEGALNDWMEQQIADVGDEDDDDNEGEGGGSKATDKLSARLEKLEKARTELNEKERQRKEQDPTGKRERDANRKRGRPYVPKVNVTDPECRTMLFPDGQGYREGYNCQIAVDQDHGLIIAESVTQDGNDLRQLEPLLRQTRLNTGWLPSVVTADSGYLNFEQIESREFKPVDFYVAARERSVSESLESNSEKMRQKLETEVGAQIYARRKAIVEPVFGILKHARKFRQVLMRGKSKVQSEWSLLCTAHNVWKLYRLGVTLA